MTAREGQRKANEIKVLKKFILNDLYREEDDEDTPFFFNLKYDDNGELVLGSGAEDEHFNLSITSKYMLSMLSNKGVFHIDGTYKITSHGYPLIVTGITDIQGKFHPTSFMISSHETRKDFVKLLKGIKDQAQMLEMDFQPEYTIVQLPLYKLLNMLGYLKNLNLKNNKTKKY